MSFVSARKNAGLSQEDAARQLGVDQSAVSFWETGRNLPRAATLVKMAGLYCCTIDELLSRDSGNTQDSA